MLIKAKRYGDVVIYRKGIGYYLKLFQLMENENKLTDEILKYAIDNFTNIKGTKIKNIKKYRNDAMNVYREIIEFNTPKIMGVNADDVYKVIDTDLISVNVVDLFNSEGYGWTKEYIFENIDFVEYNQFKEVIEKRNTRYFKLMAIAFNDSNKLNEILNDANDIEVLSWNDYKARKKCRKK